MEGTHGIVVDRKFLLVMVLVCLALGGGFALIYLDLKADFEALKNNYANLSAQINQLQLTIDALHSNQTKGLTAVQTYNLTKNSVVLISNKREDGSVVEGSGFIYPYGRGYIVTNNHVIEDYSVVKVTFIDGTVFTASAVYSDHYSDLAVLKIDVPEEMQLYPLLVGNSSLLWVGETVYAIGNPFGLVGSITEGIVSQLGRSLRMSGMRYAIVDVIQIDAAINPGNSGGPLLNSLGFVVGVNFAIATETGEFSGVGFAISSIIMQRVIPALIENGTYKHPWIGISGMDMNTDIAEAMHTNYTSGLLIISVNGSSPAETAGLRGGNSAWTITVDGNTVPLGGDIIIGVDGLLVKKIDDLLTYMERYKSPGHKITLTIVRENLVRNVSLTLAARP